MDSKFGLPQDVLHQIARQYTQAVAIGVHDYPSRSASEQAITGAFTAALEHAVHGHIGSFRWKTKSIVLSPGPGAAETRYGADFSVEIETVGADVIRKTLLVQAKNAGESDSARLLDQCRKMDALEGVAGNPLGIAIQYSTSAFTAFRTGDVVRAQGHLGSVPGGRRFDAGAILGGHFLECRIGSFDVRFDQNRRRLVHRDGRIIERSPYLVKKTVRTTVTDEARMTERTLARVRQGE